VPGRTRTRDPARGETGGWLALWIAVDRYTLCYVEEMQEMQGNEIYARRQAGM